MNLKRIKKFSTSGKTYQNWGRALQPDIVIGINCNKKGYVKNLPKPEIEGTTNFSIMLNLWQASST